MAWLRMGFLVVTSAAVGCSGPPGDGPVPADAPSRSRAAGPGVVIERSADDLPSIDRVEDPPFPEADLPTVELLQAIPAMQVFVRSEFHYSVTGDRQALEPFVLKQTEVTVQEWAECAASVDSGCPTLPADPSAAPSPLEPVRGVGFSQAQAYCRWAYGRQRLPPGYGGRLPTDAEWERAARGRGRPGRIYPSGAELDLTMTTIRGPALPPAGSSTSDRVVNGLHDMVGSLQEWVVPPPGSPADVGGLRGGHWAPEPLEPSRFRSDWRGRAAVGEVAAHRGFRCAVGPLRTG